MGEREGGKGEEEKWEAVKNRRRNKDQGRNSNPMVKFYVSNIPDGCRPWDLATTLREYGEIGGVYIARKRNKDGNKFGFVSFRGVKDGKELEHRLKKIRMGSYSLEINIAVFAMENEKNKGRSERGRRQVEVPVKPAQMGFGGRKVFGEGRNFREGMSYRDVVFGAKGKEAKTKTVVIDDSISAMTGYYKRALIGKCNDLKTIDNLRKGLKEAVI